MDALNGKAVVVTDAGTALGRAIAIRAAEAGGGVVANRLAPGAAAHIEEDGGTLVSADEDVTTTPGAERLIQAAVDRLGGVDLLVNTSRPIHDVPLAGMLEEDWDAVVNGHLRALFTCSRAATALMCEKRAGRIVNVASEEGLQGVGGQANFVAAQAGIAGFTRVVCRDVGRYGVTVNMIVTPRHPQPADEETAATLAIYLGGDKAADINGRHFQVKGRTISVLTHPVPGDALFHPGMWSSQEMSQLMPTLARA
ncbi:SDR family NAD(P)-dependent oxidoreductase [Nonomuraea sp. NPDC052116]|uniref:SDR family NAD(P)-dependent oxidoreductase n=1 Tax=Nonomuraea sp. NPDC052116 TaxID=3155665 RepID=UPI00341F9B18